MKLIRTESFFANATLMITLLCTCVGVSTSHAVVNEFSVTVDGKTPTLDSDSTDPVGVNLLPGDSFNLDLHASSGNFWRVESAFDQVFPLSFIVDPPGERIGDVRTRFQLNGTTTFKIAELGVNQQEVHIGAQQWSLPRGLEFDSVLMTYELTEVGGTTVDTIIIDRPFIFGDVSSDDRPFFRHPNISFNAVPEPAAAGMAIVALLATLCMRRRISNGRGGLSVN